MCKLYISYFVFILHMNQKKKYRIFSELIRLTDNISNKNNM